jgi:pimeloyl-ACP methyl ester carboxylesterase
MKIKSLSFYNLLRPILLFALLLFVSCGSNENLPVEPQNFSRGEIVSASSLGSYKAEFIKSSLSAYEINIDVKYSVNVFKIVYKTIDAKGSVVTASGALFVPVGKDNLSLMSLQHGTQTKRTKVGSANVQEAFEGFISAGLGYYTLVPDYLGLGESQTLHPYHIAKLSAETVIDFIRACRKEAEKQSIKLNGQVFLAGYSEGGYVTMAAHREIQKNYSGEINVTASAPMAGAYDLYATAKTILKNKNYDMPSFLAFLILSYNDYYGWNKLSTFFNSPYAEKIPPLFDGSKTTDEINAVLTTDLTKLFKQDFIDSFENGTETTLTNAFKENGLIDWAPAVPVKLFHGDADQFVPYQNSVDAYNYFKSRGADVDLITIAGGNHYTSALPSIVAAVQWFETIRLKKSFALK